MMYHGIVCLAVILGALASNVRSQVTGNDVLGLAQAVSRFSQKLYKEIAVSRPVVIFSPFSAHMTLSMAYLGAGGKNDSKTDTETEMRTVLELSGLLREPQEVYPEILLNINGVDDATVLLANGIWLNQNNPIISDYQTAIVNQYEGIADQFASSDPTVPINDWVAGRTQNKITDLLEPNAIDVSTVAVLISALYFNGTWMYPFDGKNTKKDDFKTNTGSSVQVDFMIQQEFFENKLSAAEGLVDVLRLPLANDRFALYFALPRPNKNLPEFETKVADPSYDINDLFTGLVKKRAYVAIPKFKLTSKLDLTKRLISLGMSTAFSADADFSGISQQPFSITKVHQQVEVEVQERGVIAAAAASVPFQNPPLRPVRNAPVFKADRPFMYFLRDDVTEMILFQGKQSNPTETLVEVD